MGVCSINRFKTSGAALKWLAVLSMLCDHLFKALALPFPYICQIFGRLAFPLFAFLLAEGAAHTRSFPKYWLRIAVFAIVSEVPFDLAFFGRYWYTGHQNVFLTFLLALPVLWLLRLSLERDRRFAYALPLATVAAAAAAHLLRSDYGAGGVVCILLFGIVQRLPRQYRALGAVGILATFLQSGNTLQLWALLALVPILLYNGQRGHGGKWLQYGCYLFYPAHLAGLFLIRYLFL